MRLCYLLHSLHPLALTEWFFLEEERRAIKIKKLCEVEATKT